MLSNGYSTFVSCYTFCSVVIAIDFVDIDHLFKRCSNCELQAVVFIGVVERVIRYVYWMHPIAITSRFRSVTMDYCMSLFVYFCICFTFIMTYTTELQFTEHIAQVVLTPVYNTRRIIQPCSSDSITIETDV